MGIKFDLLLGKLRETDWGPASATTPVLYSWAGAPTWVVTPSKAGDMYLDTTSWGTWITSNATNTGRREYNYMI